MTSRSTLVTTSAGEPDRRVTDPVYYVRTKLTWVATEDIDPGTGWRLDVGVNLDGEVCAVRVVPWRSPDRMPAHIAAQAAQTLSTVVSRTVEPSEAGPQLPKSLQSRVDKLVARYGTRRPPRDRRSDTLATDDYDDLVLDIEAWAKKKGLSSAAPVLQQAFGIGRAVAFRWLSDAHKAAASRS